VQFHIECDTDMIADWARTDPAALTGLGTTAAEVVARVDAIMDDLFEVWQPLAARFAALARGELARPASSPMAPAVGRELPLLGR
jgi:hypothetical protein